MYSRVLGFDFEELDGALQKKVKFLINCCLFVGGMILLYLPIILIYEGYENLLMFSSSFFIYFTPLLFLRKKRYKAAFNNLIIGFSLSIAIAMVMNGGTLTSIYIWTLVGSVVTFYLQGKKAGTYYTIFFACYHTSLFAFVKAGVEFPNFSDPSPELQLAGDLMTFVMVIFSIMYLLKLYDDTRDEQAEKLLNNKLFAEKIAWDSPNIVYIIDIEKSPKFAYQNKKGVEIFGISSSPEEYTNSIKNSIHPQDLESSDKRRERHTKLKDNEHIEYRQRLKSKNGKWIWAQIKETVFKRNEEGEPIQILGVAADITKQVDAFKKLEEMKHAIDQSTIVSVFDANGNITYANDKLCEISQLPPMQLLNKPYNTLSSELYEKRVFLTKIFALIKSGKVWIGSLQNQSRDGSTFWTNTSIIPFLNEEDQPDQFMMISFDTTKEIEYNQELEKLNKELDLFAYMVSHDLKAPVNGMKSLIEFLIEDIEAENLELSNHITQNLDLIKSSSLKLENLIGGILNYVKAGNDKEIIEIDLNETTNDIIELLNPPSTVNIHIQEDLPNIKINQTEITQIIQNLLSNAIKYSDKDATNIAVKFEHENELLKFTIKDNGPGVPDNTKNKSL